MTLFLRQPPVCRWLALAAWWVMTPPAQAQNPAPASARPQIELQCVSYGTGPMLECLVDLKRRDGAPLEGATVTLGGDDLWGCDPPCPRGTREVGLYARP